MIKGAAALVFSSLYEGFGLPPWEAALLGCPAICSKRPAMTELLQGCVLFVEPDQPKAWAEEIDRLCKNPDEGRRLVTALRDKCKNYTWAHSAEQLYNIAQEISEDYSFLGSRRGSFLVNIGAFWAKTCNRVKFISSRF